MLEEGRVRTSSSLLIAGGGSGGGGGGGLRAGAPCMRDASSPSPPSGDAVGDAEAPPSFPLPQNMRE